MKKIFTLATAAFMAMTAWAAAPELLIGETPVVSGQTYQTGYTVESFDFGTLVMYRYTQDSDLFIKASKGASVTVEVKADQQVQVCSVDGQCTMGTAVTKSGVLPTSGQDIIVAGGMVTAPLLIDVSTTDMTGAEASAVLKNIKVEVKAYYTSSPSEATTVTVELTNRPASEIGGIAGIDAETNYIRLSSGNLLDYHFNVPTKLNIYGISGALVMSQKVYSTGSVSLDSLHPGMYIYQAGKLTGKIVIRK